MKRFQEIIDILTRGTPDAVIVLSENPLDPETPVNVPLLVSWWGCSKLAMNTSLPGWDQLQEGEEWMVVGVKDSWHVIKCSLPHTKLFTEPSEYQLEDLVELIKWGDFED
jgi:hypothetical protein